MLLDANLLLYAVHERAEQHERATAWMTEVLNGPARVGFPWQTIKPIPISRPHGFERLSGRFTPPPLGSASPGTDWLAAPVAWFLQPGPEYQRIFGELVRTHHARGNLIPDAALAALAIEHGVTLASTDTDFARFRGLRWENPLD